MRERRLLDQKTCPLRTGRATGVTRSGAKKVATQIWFDGRDEAGQYS